MLLKGILLHCLLRKESYMTKLELKPQRINKGLEYPK